MKKTFNYLLLFIILLSTTSCFKKDDFDGIDIYTTVYAIEYIAGELYGDYSNIQSIYPDGVNISKHTITNKKLNDLSKGDLFIYNGLSQEKQIAASLINKNKRLKIIAVSHGLEMKNNEAELWISPSNTLMIAQNIKNGLKEYITNTSIIDEIDKNYENLKIQISEFDAELKLIAENAINKKLITTSSAFDFLSKYGFEVININNKDEEASTTSVSRAKNAINSKENSSLFALDTSDINTDDVKSLIDLGAEIITIHSLVNLTDQQRQDGDNYMTFMKTFLEAIKTEVY